MATFNKFNKFSLGLGNKVFNLGSDTLKVALTNVAPTAATDDTLSDLTEIVYTNLSARTITTTSFTETSGTSKLILADLTLTASGNVAPFRYVVIYDDTATNNELIGYADYGAEINMINGETLVIDFDGSNGAITIA